MQYKLTILLKNNMRNWHKSIILYLYYKRNTCLYYVCILHTVILCNNKKIIHHSNQGEWMEIGDKGGECMYASIFLYLQSFYVLFVNSFFGRLCQIAWPLTFIQSARGFMYEICQKIGPSQMVLKKLDHLQKKEFKRI